MRSKNLLPVQVVMPSNWMGTSHSSHKASFEEALHSSIENSLRSSSVPPSAVFSSLFFTFRPLLAKDSSEINSNVDEVEQEPIRRNSNPAVSPDSNVTTSHYTPRSSLPKTTISTSEAKGAPTFLAPSADEYHRAPQAHRKNYIDPRHATVPLPPQFPPPLLSQQQQQLEQIQQARIEQLKQLQKLQAWQQMQKDQQQQQSIIVRASVPLPAGARDHHPTTHFTGSTSLRSNKATLPRSSTSVAPVPRHLNGFLPNGALPPMHSPINLRHDLQPVQKGFCKYGKDIRLSRFENDSTKLVPYPSEYILLALQPNFLKSDITVLVAVNLKSLPPHGNSSQALSAQCVGCGEKSIHTFSHLAAHVGLEPSSDPIDSRLNSSQRIAQHACFYLVRDVSNPHKLVRGSPAVWYKTNEERMRALMPHTNSNSTPANSSSSLFRGSMIMVNPSQQVNSISVPVQESMPSSLLSSSPSFSVPNSKPHLKRALSSPLQRNALVEAGKRHFTSYSQDDVFVVPDDPTPKRYVLDEASCRHTVQIPEDFSSKHERKPIIAFLHPVSNLPQISGDRSGVIVTKKFSECFKPLSREAKNYLEITDHCSSSFIKIVLHVTVQYLVGLGFNSDFSLEGLQSFLLRTQQKIFKNGLSSFISNIQPSTLPALCRLAAASSCGSVEIVLCKDSVANELTECLRNYRSSVHKYKLLISDSNESSEDIAFHLFISGKFCRAVEENLLSRDERLSSISHGLVSYQFSQLHLALSDVARKRFHNSPTANMPSCFADQRNVTTPYKCASAHRNVHDGASSLFSTVEKIFDNLADFNLSDYTSLRFLFLLPPTSSLLTEAVRWISESKFLQEELKHLRSDVSSSSQVIETLEDSSLPRISSLCERYENTSTLMILLHLYPHSPYNSLKVIDFINSPVITRSKNVLTVQCSSHPYSLLTESSRIPLDHIVCLESYESSYLQLRNVCKAQSAFVVFDPSFEFHLESLLDKYESLHSSLVMCELLTQQYVTSLAMTSSLGGLQTENERFETCQYSSLIVNQIVQDLTSCHSSLNTIVIVRVASSILASRFFDSIKRARARLGLDKVFEVVLYKENNSSASLTSLSTYFLEILQSCHERCDEQFPSSLNDLCGIPCLIVYEGDEVVPQAMPRTLKYVDLRMSLVGRLTRSQVEQELYLAYPLCLPINENRVIEQFSQSGSVKENGLEASAEETQQNHVNPDQSNEENREDCKWTQSCNRVENQYRNKEDPLSESKRGGENYCDFISLAMKEANLPAEERCKCHHVAPVAILPESVYDIVVSKYTMSLTDLLPHSNCQWKEPIHPPLELAASFYEQASFYRKWTVPVESNPDFTNSSRDVDSKRFLLVSPSSSPIIPICTQFIRSLSCKLQEYLDVTVYDDTEDNTEEEFVEFRTLIANNVERGISQIVNCCFNMEELHQYINQGRTYPRRSVQTRRCQFALSSLKRFRNSFSNLTNGVSRIDCSISVSIGDGIKFCICIPHSQADKFRYSATENGNLDSASLKLKQKSDSGIRTPVITIAHHDIKEGLFNIPSVKNDVTHLLIVRSVDADMYKANFRDIIIVTLPTEFDFMGKGAMKYAAQNLMEYFYFNERKNQTDPDLVWPFFLLRDDDVITFSKLYKHDNNSSFWNDIPFTDVITSFETIAHVGLSAVGFRPWCSRFPVGISQENVFTEDNSFSCCCVESAIFFNINSFSSVRYSISKFSNEDIDLCLRAAACGLKMYRFQNIAMVTKVMNLTKIEADLMNCQSALVTTADSEFEPLRYHPGLLLEKYLGQCASLVFPSSVRFPSRPVLCVDTYISLGNQICVQFISSEKDAQQWAIDKRKQYGGLVLLSPSNNVDPKFLEGFQFSDGAVVCVIGTDRNILRQTVVRLQLETNWHFRLTDEFQTANDIVLGDARVRPFYFLTGVKKES